MVGSFAAFGLRLALRTDAADVLEKAANRLPPGWRTASRGAADILYSIRVARRSARDESPHRFSLYCGSAPIARGLELSTLLAIFEEHAERLTALRARDVLFVHAGVVGWNGRAIVIPGRSLSGKTTLVKALVQNGAAYYSDEFAVLDKDGCVRPYLSALSIRSDDGRPPRRMPPENFGERVGREPLPVGSVVITTFRAGASWRPVPRTPGQALLALMDNTVAARRAPRHSMPILRATVLHASAVAGERGEAGAVARALLGP